MKDKTVCDYCGRTKEKVGFFIGASLGNSKDGYDWTMWEGTGKISCASPTCYAKGREEGQTLIKELIPLDMRGRNK